MDNPALEIGPDEVRYQYKHEWMLHLFHVITHTITLKSRSNLSKVRNSKRLDHRIYVRACVCLIINLSLLILTMKLWYAVNMHLHVSCQQNNLSRYFTTNCIICKTRFLFIRMSLLELFDILRWELSGDNGELSKIKDQSRFNRFMDYMLVISINVAIFRRKILSKIAYECMYIVPKLIFMSHFMHPKIIPKISVKYIFS